MQSNAHAITGLLVLTSFNLAQSPTNGPHELKFILKKKQSERNKIGKKIRMIGTQR